MEGVIQWPAWLLMLSVHDMGPSIKVLEVHS